MSEVYDLIILIGLGGGLYWSYKKGYLQDFIDMLGNISLGGGGGSCGGGTGMGSPRVSKHGLQSGGTRWRKQWTLGKRFLNAEFCAYFFIPSNTKLGENIAIKLRGGPHSGSGDNATTRQGCCYDFALPFNGSNNENFQKECPHPDYQKHDINTSWNPGDIRGKWIGIRASTVNEGGGVRCKMALDTSGRQGANQWREWYSVLDTNGKYGSGPRSAPFTRSPVYGNSPQVIVRIDALSQGEANGYKMSNAGIREIGGGGSGFTQVYPQAQVFQTTTTSLELDPAPSQVIIPVPQIQTIVETKPRDVLIESYLAHAGRLRRRY